MPPACVLRRRLWGRLGTRRRDRISELAWERPCVPPTELEEVAEEREV